MQIKLQTNITDEQISFLLSSGLTERQILNYIKKNCTYEEILKAMPKKIEENKARMWLKERFNSTNIPTRKLPKTNKWVLQNPNQTLKLTLPLQISTNLIHITSPSTNGRLLSCVAKKCIVENWDIVEKEIVAQNWQATHKTFLYADMKFYYPDNKIRDSHNMFKLLFDSLQGIVFDNDYYILPRVQFIGFDHYNPRIEVNITVYHQNLEGGNCCDSYNC